jgi:hypothetical protein
MPDVGSNQFRAAKGVNNFVEGIPYGKDGTTGGPNNDGWKYGIAVYAHNGTSWVEVWNARPEMVSSTFTVSSATELSFAGTADPNNFATTATFEYREVGGTYADAGTTTTGLGNNINGAVNFSVTKTGIDGFKNWEARAKGTNTAGTGVGSVLTRDCRKHNVSGVPANAWGTSVTSTTSVSCGTCGSLTRTVTAYSRDGCPGYSVTTDSACTEATCGCATASTNGWSALQTRYRDLACGTNCGLQSQYQTYITKAGCTEVIVTDWTDNGGCANEAGYVDVSDELVSGNFFAGVRFNVGTFGFFGPTAIYTYTNSRCGLSGPCCGGNGIKYYSAQRCSYVPSAERWVELGCYAPI